VVRCGKPVHIRLQSQRALRVAHARLQKK